MTTTLDLDIARRAHAYTSFTPERRAEQEHDAVESRIAALAAELAPLAVTEDQRAILAERMAAYREGYISRYHAYLTARSRTASPLITGRANFPTRRNQQRMETERRRALDLTDWDERARKSTRAAILAARTDEQADDDAWRAVQRWIDADMRTVAAIDAGDSPFNRAAFVNSVVGKLRRLADNGQTAIVARALDYIRERQANQPKPFITPRHSVWSLAAETASAAAKPAATGAEEIANRPGVRAIKNHDLARIQLFFDAIPPAEQRASLKSTGWRWSPTHQAWQRQITNAAEYALSTFLATYYPA